MLSNAQAVFSRSIKYYWLFWFFCRLAKVFRIFFFLQVMFLVQELFLAASKVATRLDDADGFQGDNFLWLHISGICREENYMILL